MVIKNDAEIDVNVKYNVNVVYRGCTRSYPASLQTAVQLK